jgi:GDP-mannose 6-dehydrogenase
MRISIFGLGYVGCVSAGCLAYNGHSVIGVDVDTFKVDTINSGKATIIEKDIDEIIEDCRNIGSIEATSNVDYAITNTDVSIICVGTPINDEGHLNLNYIYRVSEQIGEALKNKDGFHIIVIRSTVKPHTNNEISTIIEQESGKTRNIDFAIVVNPEFLREGTAVSDYYNPPYTLLGSDNDDALATMEELYRNINAPIFKTEITVAEVIKYINNSFHALKITFANEVGNIGKALNIDSHEVMDLVCKDNKLNISPYYLKPGVAYGGSCLPKDLKALVTLSNDLNVETPLLGNIERSNELHKEKILKEVIKTGKKRVGILGLSFKAGTDDLRESPMVDLVERLIGK